MVGAKQDSKHNFHFRIHQISYYASEYPLILYHFHSHCIFFFSIKNYLYIYRVSIILYEWSVRLFQPDNKYCIKKYEAFFSLFFCSDKQPITFVHINVLIRADFYLVQ